MKSPPPANDYRTVERCIRLYPKSGSYIATVTRHDPTSAAGFRTYLRSGLKTIEEARAARAELEAQYPPRRQGRHESQP